LPACCEVTELAKDSPGCLMLLPEGFCCDQAPPQYRRQLAGSLAPVAMPTLAPRSAETSLTMRALQQFFSRMGRWLSHGCRGR